jgi:hypothetical protein
MFYYIIRNTRTAEPPDTIGNILFYYETIHFLVKNIYIMCMTINIFLT